MAILLGLILLVIGAFIAWGGFSGRMPNMVKALGS